MYLNLPYKVQYASLELHDQKCEGEECFSSFDRSELVVLKKNQSADDDKKYFVLFHKQCFIENFPSNLRTCQIENFENIKYKDQLDIMSQIIKTSGADKILKLEETTLKKISVKKSTLEEKCFECLKPIKSNKLRIRISTRDSKTVQNNDIQDYSMHFSCFFDNRNDLALHELQCSFEPLQHKHHELTENSTEHEVKNKKLQFENVSFISAVETKIASQTENFFAVRQHLKKCGIEDLHLFLVLNGYEVSVNNEEELIDVCADVLTFGIPEKCQKCFKGDMVFSKYGYACNAWTDEWIKCGNFEIKPKRMIYTIPDDLRGNKYLKMLKPQIEDRVLRAKCIDPTHFEETSSKVSPEDQTNQTNEVIIQIKRGAAVDLQFDSYCSTRVYRDIYSLYSCVLVLVDIEQNQNSYFKLQVIEYDDLDHQRFLIKSKIPCFNLFTSWGRIGTTIGKSNVKAFQSVDSAIAEYEKVYNERTGNDWNMRRKLVKMNGKYFPTDVNYTHEIFDLFKMISPDNIFEKQMLDYKLDLQKLPLGKLRFQQLRNAQETLSTIKKAIQGESSHSLLIGLSNKFFSMVPQKFKLSAAPILDSFSKVTQHLVLMESLFAIEQDYSRNLCNSLQLNADIEVLDKHSELYSLIETYIKNTTVHGYKLVVTEIFKIQRHEEVERYAPYKNFANRQLLWHGSGIQNFLSIIRNGLKAPEVFGRGIYFADVASKSVNYSRKGLNDPIGLLALCEVALGNIFESDNPEKLVNLPLSFDSVKGLGKFQPDVSQARSTDDEVLIPLGTTKVIQDRDYSTLHLEYNEYIVYNEAQITLKYLVKFQKE